MSLPIKDAAHLLVPLSLSITASSEGVQAIGDIASDRGGKSPNGGDDTEEGKDDRRTKKGSSGGKIQKNFPGFSILSPPLDSNSLFGRKWTSEQG